MRAPYKLVKAAEGASRNGPPIGRRPRFLAIALALCLLADLAGIAVVMNAAFGGQTARVDGRSPIVSSTQAPRARPTGRWTRVGPATLVKAILVAPGNPRTLYAATTDGFLRSDDGGQHWAYHNAGFSGEGRSLWDLVVFDQGRRLAAAGSDGHVYLSSTRGDRWTSSGQMLGSGAVYALAAGPDQPHTLLASGEGGIWRSGDSGAHWRFVQGTGSRGVAAFAWQGRSPVVYAALLPGPEQVLRSADAGLTWHPDAAGLDPQAALMAIQTGAGAGAVLAGSMGHGIWRLATPGRRWQPSNGGFPAAGHGASFALATARRDIVWVGTMGDGVYVSRDGGRDWERFGPALHGSAGIVLALASDAGHLYAGTAAGIFRIPVS